MDLKRELTDYEIGGIGDIKKHTLRFHSYRIGTEDGKLTIYAEYEPGKPPRVFSGYPSGQELLIELCNLNLELRDKPLEECARILIRWSLENMHPYYFYGDDVAHLEMNNDDPNGFWDCMVNMLESYRVFVEDMVQDLEQLYTDTMTAFAIRCLMEGKSADAQRIYDGVCVPEQENLLREWYRTDSAHRPLVLQRFVEKISKLNMGLEYDPERIGTISMSAGSHLALLLATSSQTRAYTPVDKTDSIGCHINWAIVSNRIGYLALRHLFNQIFCGDRIGCHLMDQNTTTQLLVEIR